MSLKCPECEYVTEYKNILSRHINKNHTNILEPKKCPMCLKIFASVATCKRHVERKVCQKDTNIQQDKEKDPPPSPSVTETNISEEPLVYIETEIQPDEQEAKHESVFIEQMPTILKVKFNYFKYIALSITIIVGKILYTNIRKISKN